MARVSACVDTTGVIFASAKRRCVSGSRITSRIAFA